MTMVITIATPSRIRTGIGEAVADEQPFLGHRDPVRGRVLLHDPLGPGIGVHDQRDRRCRSRSQAPPRKYSAHMGRCGNPWRCRFRRPEASIHRTAAQPRSPTTHDAVDADGPVRPAAQKREVGVDRRDRAPGRQKERRAPPDQEAAQRHDEGGDAAVGDKPALEGADRRADGKAEGGWSARRSSDARCPRAAGSHSTWNMPIIMAQKPSIEPTDRSMWRMMMISTMPQAMIPTDDGLDR